MPNSAHISQKEIYLNDVRYSQEDFKKIAPDFPVPSSGCFVYNDTPGWPIDPSAPEREKIYARVVTAGESKIAVDLIELMPSIFERHNALQASRRAPAVDRSTAIESDAKLNFIEARRKELPTAQAMLEELLQAILDGSEKATAQKILAKINEVKQKYPPILPESQFQYLRQDHLFYVYCHTSGETVRVVRPTARPEDAETALSALVPSRTKKILKLVSDALGDVKFHLEAA